jgi:ubiquinone/menaquinone biosynthesis C-methylase UbiE
MPNEHNEFQLPDEHPEAGQPWSDELAQWYVQNYGEHPAYKLALQAAALAGSETLLDIGCGNGAAVRAAALELSTGKAIGVDLTPAMVRIAVEQSNNHPARTRLQFLEAPAENLPMDDGTVDVAIAIGSLHHWLDIPKGLVEIARVLRAGGRLIVVEDIFDDPSMGMDSAEISRLIDASPLSLKNLAKQSHAEGQAQVFTAAPGDRT